MHWTSLTEDNLLKFIGDDLKARDANGELRSRIATIFPRAKVIVTVPGSHTDQRLAFIHSLNSDRAQGGQPPLSEDEECAEMEQSVDLFIEEQGAFIRPDPLHMELALEADEQLQEIMPKRLIQFLGLTDRRVRDVLKKRGECWRMFRPPTQPEEIRRTITDARSSIEGRPIYYYSPITGTRLLTYDSLCHLSDFDDAELRKHVCEIASYGSRRNRNGCSEIEFFMADPHMDPADFLRVGNSSPQDLRSAFNDLCAKLCASVPLPFQIDDLDDATWRMRMFTRLMMQRADALADQQSMGLDPDFSMRVEWLPGGRIEEGELILDPAIEDGYGRKQEKQVSPVVRGLILNLVQEFGDLEYINLGSVLPSPRRNELRGGRREVYVAQIKQRGAAAEVLQVIRMQKWGVRERLDKNKNLEDSMIESEGYTEYILDRRLACRQLGMNIVLSQRALKVSEEYDGFNEYYRGYRIWSPYFQRDYIAGIPTDQVPARKLADSAYAAAFARLFGRAAATNLIVGRAELSGEVIFDVGDEIVVENPSGLPVNIIVADHVGTFVDWTGPLEARAPQYAAPIRNRLPFVADRQQFINAFLSGFADRFIHTKEEYLKHQRAFDTLFKHRPWDPGGSHACRWSHVLKRLRGADAMKLTQLIAAEIQK
jgi:hypothetical protein